MGSPRQILTTLVLAAALLAGLGCAAPPPAGAHSALESSWPEAGEKATTSPERVVLTFGEDPDPRLSLIRIVDSAGRLIPGATAAQPVEGHPDQLQVRIADDLATGVYSVNWLAVSAEDGHVEGGAFAFGVRVVPPPGSTVEVPLSEVSAWTDALSAVGRWLLYWGLVVMGGAAVTGLVVFGRMRPVANGDAGAVPVDDAPSGAVRWVTQLPPPAGGVTALRISLAAAVAGLILMTAAERQVVGAPSLLPLFLTSEGQRLLWLGVALALCIVAVVLFDLWPARWSLAVIGVTAAIAMLVHVLSGHADAVASWRVLNVIAQWVHMMAIGAWIGGLAWLLLSLRERTHPDRAAATRAFSYVATVALAAVLLTGALRGAVQLRSPGEVLTTGYGVTLAVKVALVAAIAALGAHNHFRLVPGLARGEATYRPFSLNSRSELALAAAVLLVTALLVGMAPPIG